ncbi:MAG: glycosyltransferase family 4 protein [Candidatus Methanosuratincola petrocarbonis]
MRVLIITNDILNPYLGPSAVAHNLMKGFIQLQEELVSDNVEINFLSLGSDTPKQLMINNNVRVINDLRTPLITLTGEIQAIIKRPKGHFDILHSHSLYDLPMYFFKPNTIFTMHGLFWKESKYTSNFYMRLYYSLAEARLRLYYPHLSHLVAISPYIIDELKRKGFDTNKAVLIGNPVGDEFFSLEKEEEGLTVLFPAVLSLRKNQLVLLRAVGMIKEELGDYKLIFTGSGDAQYAYILKRYAEKNGINAHFTGKIPYKELLRLYSKSSLTTLTSFEETFGMSVLESMATGTPLIASDIPAFRNLVEDGKEGFLVNPHDPK